MRYLSLLPLLLLWCGVAAHASDCIEVAGRMVRATDVAAQVPAFAALAADTVLGYAPAPGGRRFWSAGQLTAILVRNGSMVVSPAESTMTGICVERPARTYSASEVERALLETLPVGSHLRVLDFCRLPMPVGALEFDRKGLPAPGSHSTGRAAFVWRGRVRYEPHRSTPFWASVSVAVPQDGYFAAADLALGHTLTAQDLVHETRLTAPSQPQPETDPALLIGAQCRHAIAAGSPLNRRMLALPPEIDRGDTVEVVVESGSARVKFPALADTAGHTGESILVENFATGKHLKVRVTGPGRATALASESYVTKAPSRAGLRAGSPRGPLVVRASKAQTEGDEPVGPIPPGS